MQQPHLFEWDCAKKRVGPVNKLNMAKHLPQHNTLISNVGQPHGVRAHSLQITLQM